VHHVQVLDEPGRRRRPITIMDDDVYSATPFSTATVSRSTMIAAKAINAWLENQGGGYWRDGDKFTVEVDK